ncbi:MAG: DUF3137 domain-containing protein [Oscillospiraceae bacterium]|nr:DUF3137 domain-containing protein [Oscillospiraceae bacterium]
MSFNLSDLFNGQYNKQNQNQDYLAVDLRTPVLNDYELFAKINELKQKRNTSGFALSTGMIITAALLFFFFPMLLPFMIISVVFTMLRNSSKNKEIKELITNNIVRGALSEVMELSYLSYNAHIPAVQIDVSGITAKWDKCSGSDMVQGRYKGVNISFSDILLTKRKRSGRRTYDETVFKGQWLTIELAKQVDGELKLIERGAGDKFKRSKSDIETENVAFNQKFQILTNNPHSAFYVLTPHFMDYINSMDMKARAKTSMWFNKSFGKSCVHVALNNNSDLFEFNARQINSPYSFAPIRDNIKREVRYITGVIDELLLNDYLFNANIK